MRCCLAGFVVEMMSFPVISGFTSAAAIVIAEGAEIRTSVLSDIGTQIGCMLRCCAVLSCVVNATGQIKHILGLKHIRRDFIDSVGDLIYHIKETNVNDLVLGLVCCVVLVALQALQRK